MFHGRKSIPIDKISEIVELTKQDLFRSEIIERTGLSESTVYKYQRKFNLL